MRRREFITSLSVAAALAFAARAQEPAMPVVALVNAGSAETSERNAAAFDDGLRKLGYIEGKNVTIERHWLAGHYDQVDGLMTDLVRRHVALIATPGSAVATLAAKKATSAIPIVFGMAQDPVQLGVVASLARPNGNATGVSSLLGEIAAKRLQLLHDLVPAANRIVVLVNPSNSTAAESTIRDVREAAPGMGLQIQILNATNIAEIDAAFASFARVRPDALFVAPDGFFRSRRGQFSTLAARDKLPAAYSGRDYVVAGGLMSCGPDLAETYHQAGLYTGKILNGEKPANMPVLQSTKFEFVINLQTARALGIEVSPDVLSIADEVIE